jgi:transcription elongation factor GreB
LRPTRPSPSSTPADAGDGGKSAKKGDGALVKRPMTREGFKKLAAEHDELLLVERPKVVQGIATAAAEGDRSENAEYIYGKKRLRELDKRLRYLSGLLKHVKLVDPERLGGDKVCFGSTVVVRDEEGGEKEYTIVGEGESDHRAASISFKSPVARALTGKRVGDVVVVQRPAGEIELEIVDLKFAGRSWEEPPVLAGAVPTVAGDDADSGDSSDP